MLVISTQIFFLKGRPQWADCRLPVKRAGRSVLLGRSATGVKVKVQKGRVPVLQQTFLREDQLGAVKKQ